MFKTRAVSLIKKSNNKHITVTLKLHDSQQNLKQFTLPQAVVLYKGKIIRDWIHLFLDEKGDLRKKDSDRQDGLPGRRWVLPLVDDQGNIIAYLKILPEMPGYQLAVDTLTWSISGHGLSSRIACLQVDIQGGKPKRHPVLLTAPAKWSLQQIIRGEAFEDGQLLSLEEVEQKLDDESFALFLLATLLVNPEDDQWTNLGIESFTHPSGEKRYRFIRFDGDHAFVDELDHRFTVSFRKEKLANVKSVLFLLNKMKEAISLAAIQRFLNLQPEQVMTHLLNYIQTYHNTTHLEDAALFKEQDIQNYFESRNSSFIPCLILPNLIEWLFYRLHHMQAYLRENFQHGVTGYVDVFEEMLPRLHVLYAPLLSADLTPVQRFKCLPKNYQQRSLSYSLFRKHTLSVLLRQPREEQLKHRTNHTYIYLQQVYWYYITLDFEGRRKHGLLENSLAEHLNKLEWDEKIEESLNIEPDFQKTIIQSIQADQRCSLSKLTTYDFLKHIAADWPKWVNASAHQNLRKSLKEMHKQYQGLCWDVREGENTSALLLFLRRYLKQNKPKLNPKPLPLIQRFIQLQQADDIMPHSTLDLQPHAEFVTDSILESIVNRMCHLEKLTISGCNRLTVRAFEILRVAKCPLRVLIARNLSLVIPELKGTTGFPHLEQLVLDNNPGLKQLTGRWPHLKTLFADNSGIVVIEIDAPRLIELSANNWTQLIQLKSERQSILYALEKLSVSNCNNLRVIDINAPNLREQVKVKDCQNLFRFRTRSKNNELAYLDRLVESWLDIDLEPSKQLNSSQIEILITVIIEKANQSDEKDAEYASRSIRTLIYSTPVEQVANVTELLMKRANKNNDIQVRLCALTGLATVAPRIADDP